MVVVSSIDLSSSYSRLQTRSNNSSQASIGDNHVELQHHDYRRQSC
jgi:hypothetical protein